MPGIKVIITGATGMVGEGVLFECLQNAKVSEVLIVNRRHYELSHLKLKELIVPDFFQPGQFAESIKPICIHAPTWLPGTSEGSGVKTSIRAYIIVYSCRQPILLIASGLKPAQHLIL